MFKFTVVRTDKKNVQHMKLLTIEDLLEKAGSDYIAKNVEPLREFAQYPEFMSRPSLSRLPVVFPFFEGKDDAQGNVQLVRFSGILTLSRGLLNAQSCERDAEEVKRVASMLPMTVAALVGSSGRTVKVLVRTCRPDGALPQNEEQAAKLCRQAFPLACRLYAVALSSHLTTGRLNVTPAKSGGEADMLHMGFRMSYDAKPFYNAEAAPLLIADDLSEEMPEEIREAQDSEDSTVAQETQALIDLLESRYTFRMNSIMGYVEYASKNGSFYGWRPVDERARNSLVVEARLKGINAWDRDINRLLVSSHVKLHDPVEDYLWELRGKWDGRDHIGELAATVPTNNARWPMWFRTWFLAMVNQWQRHTMRYGNSLVPLLISKQGYNKSTFCKSLIPSELQWGYNDSLVLSEKKSVLQAMSQFLLINLDEFNQISPKVQEGFLKNVVQLASVKVKPPYGKHVENFPRRASFIATANVSDILTDPSGSRRFIGVELTGPIDVKHRINYRQLYAQAVALLEQNVPHWLDEEQTREVMASNQQFQMRTPEEMYFAECFDIVTDESDGQWMSATAIFEHIRKHAGSGLKNPNLLRFSRIIANIGGIRHTKTRNSSMYLVRPIKAYTTTTTTQLPHITA